MPYDTTLCQIESPQGVQAIADRAVFSGKQRSVPHLSHSWAMTASLSENSDFTSKYSLTNSGTLVPRTCQSVIRSTRVVNWPRQTVFLIGPPSHGNNPSPTDTRYENQIDCRSTLAPTRTRIHRASSAARGTYRPHGSTVPFSVRTIGSWRGARALCS